MKKTFALFLAVAALLAGGVTIDAKTSKTKTKSKTSHAARKSSKETVYELKTGDDTIKFYSNGKYETKNNEGYSYDSGFWVWDEGIYIYASENFGRAWVVYGGEIYDLDGLTQEGAIDWNLLPNVISSNGYQLEKVLNTVKFDPETETVSHNFEGKSGRFKLSQIPESYRSRIN